LFQEASATIRHTIPQEEKARFVEHINNLLKGDPDLKGVLPINPGSMEFFEKVKDGVILAYVFFACRRLGLWIT
jgi:hypothetical protein